MIKTKKALKAGDKVRLTGKLRHDMVPVGSVGEVTEIRDSGSPYTDGVVVTFMILPRFPHIARMFGKDPSVPEAHNCLFPKGCRLPFEVVG
jgi:hypothetical protein